MAEFGEQLRKVREEKGITQQTLAEKVYVTRQTISRYETGERYPDLVTLKNLSSVLEVSADFLLGDEEMKKVVEKNPIIEKPLFNNIVVALYTLIVFTYAIFIVNQTPMSALVKETTGNGGSYLWFVLFNQILSMCLFIYGLFVALNGSMNPQKTGRIMMLFLLLEGSKSFYYLVHSSFGGINLFIVFFAIIIILIYVLGIVCAYFYFVKNRKQMLSICGVIGIACFGIYRQIASAYQILMFADHMYSWINSVLTFLMITINVLFIYQAVMLNIKRKQASELFTAKE